jgi:hypothetical protein
MDSTRLRARFTLFLLPFVFGAGLAKAAPAVADPISGPMAQPTAFLTPTPGSDGRIVYTVQSGDTFFDIAAIAGITLEELYALNGIQPEDYAIPGTSLVLGFVSPTEEAIDPNMLLTLTPAQPTPTPLFSTGEICVLLFLDENGNARLEESESPLVGGKISVVDVSGVMVAEITTGDDPEGQCFKELEAGDYNISAAMPEEYNATTSMNLPLRLIAGDIKYVQFGAQPSAAMNERLPDQDGERSLLFGIFGIAMILMAAGLAFYASRYRRQPPIR